MFIQSVVTRGLNPRQSRLVGEAINKVISSINPAIRVKIEHERSPALVYSKEETGVLTGRNVEIKCYGKVVDNGFVKKITAGFSNLNTNIGNITIYLIDHATGAVKAYQNIS